MTFTPDTLLTNEEHVGHSSPLSILCVDDDATIRKSLERLFKGEDFKVLTAASGEEGLQILRTNGNICLILSDQMMPGISGTEFLESAQKFASEIPRMILTGQADLQSAVNAINAGGVCRYFSKPWNNDELRQIVRDVVEQFRLKKENERLAGIIARQNEELVELNASLKKRVLEQTKQLRRQIEELRAQSQKSANVQLEPLIMSFLCMIEVSNEKFYRHARTVAALSEAMARTLGLDTVTCNEIRVAALLHDIGVTGFSGAFENKNLEEMNFREKAEFLQHPVRGQVAVTVCFDFQNIGLMIRHHHEAYNGTGFPDKLSGSEIPLGSRIIAVANFAEKIYSNTWPSQGRGRTVEMVQSRMGSEFDPQLNHAFMSAIAGIAEAPIKYTSTTWELYPQDLVPGLVVCEEVRSGTGVVLLQAGTTITAQEVTALQAYQRMDPFRRKVKVC